MMNRSRAALLVWLAALATCVALISQTRFVADMSAFLPRAPNARQQMLVDQLRDGIIARLVMAGVEGGDAAERARISRELAAQLRQDPAFVGIQNGEAAILERDQAYFFNNRYLLSPGVTAQRFTGEGLHGAISNSLESLSGSAGLMMKQLLARDPTGETLELIEQFGTTEQPRNLEGVWASRDGKRALLLLQVRAAGSDLDAQSVAIDKIRAAFAQAQHGNTATRLVMSGTGVFSVSSRQMIEGEVSKLATLSTLIVVCLLLAIYRSPRLLVLGLLPVLSGALVGIATVGLGFGSVHGLTLGFGTTLIGEAVDYSIYLFIQRQHGSSASSFWRTIRLGVLSSITGFAALLFSGFPGLAQLGLYSISGLIAAALVTRYVLPTLMPAQVRLRDLSRVALRLDQGIAWAARGRLAIAVLLLAAAGLLIWRGDSVLNRELSALSPVREADQALDAQLRGDMGAPEMRYMVALSATDTEQALQAAERVGSVLRPLVKAGVINGFTSPAGILPSEASQEQRRAALPEESELRNRLDQALKGLPVKAERLQGFVGDVSAARSHAYLTRKDLDGTSSALLVDSLLVPRAKDMLVLMPLRAPASGTLDVARVEQALAGLPAHAGVNLAATVIDLRTESFSLYAAYLREASTLAGLGCLAIAALLCLALRSAVRALRICAPLACAVLCVAAGLVACGTTLTILHLVGLLLVVAVGSNYALFFDQNAIAHDDGERRQTLVSLFVANLTTVSSFGTLACSQVPVLSAIGITVAPGAFLALVFSAMLAHRPKAAR